MDRRSARLRTIGRMPFALSNLFGAGARRAVDSIEPRRTFEDVILPVSTRRALDQALVQVTSYDLVFNRWGLGETPKNVAAVFRLAREQRAVLLFDEADAIAARRSTSVEQGSQRESNLVVNVLLQELESFTGVVIFATNLAANFDPAFERRIRSHVLFEMPGIDEREQIWRVQMHPRRTPLALDVDFRQLAESYEVSGGDIRNAVLKAALAAAAEPGPDSSKVIEQRHLHEGIHEVMAAKR